MQEVYRNGMAVDKALASWTQHAIRNPMQDALSLSVRPGIICFSLGLPSPELFPLEQFRSACDEILARGSGALQYGPPLKTLKSHIVSLMRIRGVECEEEEIVLTSGAQQAVHLIVALLLDRGRQIIAEELCYPGFRQIVEFYDPEILTVPTDPKTGMDLDKVEWHLAQGARPAFIYTIPDGHNPLGVSLSAEKRTRLLAMSQQYSVPIIEEDPYGFLSYAETSTKSIRAHGADLVFYIGSFSKMIAPSMRLGWLVVPKNLSKHLVMLKESLDINTATFTQHVVACMLDSGFLSQHLAVLRSEYKRRRDSMLAALSRRFPVGSEWNSPESGVFIWVRLPKAFDTRHLLEVAVTKYGVAFMPGSVFCTLSNASGARSSLRLNFSHPLPARIDEGIARLGEMLDAAVSLRLAAV
jgi:2-aminoadipate transaminase